MPYKFLTADQKGSHSYFDFTPYLPKGSKPGKWLPKIESLEMCSSGYHVTDFSGWRTWRNAEMYEVEVRGDSLAGNDKTAHQQMRFVRKIDAWNKDTLTLFAVKCARRSLKHYETKFPNDTRVRDCLNTVERYAKGKASIEDVRAARRQAEQARFEAWSKRRRRRRRRRRLRRLRRLRPQEGIWLAG
jgi:hypothetical protein